MSKLLHSTALRRTFSTLVGAMAGAVMLASGASAFSPESTDPIRIAQHDWAGSEFSSHLLARLLGELGYNVEVVTIDSSSVYTALENGDLAFQVEAWSSNHPEMPPLIKAGKMTDVGESGLQGMDRYWYPDYVKDMCPGLPDYKALSGCAKLFATAETGEKGRLLVYPESWGGHDEERLANLGLNFEVVHAGSEAALLAEVKSAVQRKAPILAWLYEPHWAPVQFKGQYVTLPPYTEECYATKSYACERPHGRIYKLAWNDAKAKWPQAFKVFEAFKLDNKEYGESLIDISLNGKSVSEAIDIWMEKNKDRWTAWLQ
ncbi:ABC transporter substrate-binding protein [Aminobacter sp. BA135]|uniref:ABC transporter substrate-binding protein n=1 Tax=Aminobacter sp. BA135 TaxID=537596 RepID=UPI003D7BD572